MRLYEGSVKRQNRLYKVMAAAMGADVSGFDEEELTKTKPRPAYAIDPSEGGEALPAYGEEEIAQLPINLGYSIIKKDD